MMQIHAHPLTALCDRKIEFRISGLSPGSTVKISASLCLPWAKNLPFQSQAWFTADALGEVDLSRQKPDSGSYDFIDSMGPIVSVTSQNPKVMEKIVQGISVDQSLFIDLVAESGSDRATVRLERLFKSPEVQSERFSQGFVGEFFFSGEEPRPTIVWLGGSGSSLAINSLVCAPLASQGFNVLSVAYFGEPGVPSHLSRVPLEYFERVFTWLAAQPRTAGQAVQILGMSKGAEAALILASRYPAISRVALWAPHAYCFQGLAFRNESSWTAGGVDLPFIRLKLGWVFQDLVRCFLKKEPFGFTRTYRKALQVAKNKDAARIPLETVRAEVYLVAGRDCGMWNTADGSQEILDTLDGLGEAPAHEGIFHDQAGEPYLVPYVIPAGLNSVRMAPRIVLSMGGTLEGNTRAVTEAWEGTLAFFRRPKSPSTRW